MFDLKGLEYPLFAGGGAIIGLFIGSPIIGILSIFFPALIPWIFAPVAAGAVIGLLAALKVQ